MLSTKSYLISYSHKEREKEKNMREKKKLTEPFFFFLGYLRKSDTLYYLRSYDLFKEKRKGKREENERFVFSCDESRKSC